MPNFSNEFVSYRPLVDTPALFRTFAELEPTEEGFRSFANQFGQLGTRQWAVGIGMGDSLSRFLAEHQALKQVVGMLDALRQPTRLRKYAEAFLTRDRGLYV